MNDVFRGLIFKSCRPPAPRLRLPCVDIPEKVRGNGNIRAASPDNLVLKSVLEPAYVQAATMTLFGDSLSDRQIRANRGH